MEVLHVLEEGLVTIAEFGIVFLEFVGLCVLLVAAVRAIIGLFNKSNNVGVLAKGIALALQFMMGGEVLHTVTVHDWKGIATLACILGLRAIIGFIVHWEMKHEEEAEAADEVMDAMDAMDAIDVIDSIEKKE